MTEDPLTPGEVAVLVDGLTDDVSLGWLLTDLGLHGRPGPPTAAEIDAAFTVVDRLVGRGLARVGRLEYVDGGPPGRVAPVRHVAEPPDLVRRRVQEAVSGPDWEFSCWLVTTEAGHEVARAALADRPQPG